MEGGWGIGILPWGTLTPIPAAAGNTLSGTPPGMLEVALGLWLPSEVLCQEALNLCSRVHGSLLVTSHQMPRRGPACHPVEGLAAVEGMAGTWIDLQGDVVSRLALSLRAPPHHVPAVADRGPIVLLADQDQEGGIQLAQSP
jgi:hypothetical protein